MDRAPDPTESPQQQLIPDALKPKAPQKGTKGQARTQKRDPPPEEFFCSFCGRSHRSVKKMIAGAGVYICDSCTELCVEILTESGHTFKDVPHLNAPLRVADLGLNPIFNRLEIPQRADHCFYLGPFSDPFNQIYRDHLVPALATDGLTVSRADEIFSVDVVIEDIWASIVSAALIVADLTTKNANVLYEVGMAHTVGRPVIILTQDLDDVPFDLRHRRCLVYSHTPRGCRKLEKELAATAKAILTRSAASV